MENYNFTVPFLFVQYLFRVFCLFVKLFFSAKVSGFPNSQVPNSDKLFSFVEVKVC